MHAVAVVGTKGTIDWYCCPAFDAPSVFWSILDKDRGGFYSLHPTGDEWSSRHLYFPDTNVLITRFFLFQAEDGIRDGTVTGVRRVLFRSLGGRLRSRIDRGIDLQAAFDHR